MHFWPRITPGGCFLFIFEVFIQEKLNKKQSSVKQVSEQLNMEKYQI